MPKDEQEDHTTNTDEYKKNTSQPTAENEQDEQPEAAPEHETSERRGRIKGLWHWCKTHKKITIPVVILVVLAVLLAIPFTRYALAGTFLKQNFMVKVVDSETKKPISGASVTLDGKKVLTDNQGVARARVAVGEAKLSVQKQYYKGATKEVLVPILKQKAVAQIAIQATGRQVPVSVIHTLTKKPLSNAEFKIAGVTTKTDKDGKAVLVLPADKDKVEATLSLQGYNTATTTVQVTPEEVQANVFQLTSAGKIYFLSNLTGKLDVVKSNLDGTDRQVVLAGTGKEDKSNTVLLASRDWKYLALLSKRDGGDFAKLFLIETATDRVTPMDEGKAELTVYGWADHRFLYKVNRTEVKYWQANRFALKSYDAPSQKITTLDQAQAEGNELTGYAAQDFGPIYLLNDLVLYSVSWNGYSPIYNGKSHVIRSIQTNGQGKKDYKSFAVSQYSGITSNPYEFNEIYYQLWDLQANKYAYFEFENNKIEQVQVSESDFRQTYPTYYISPSAKQTLWGESRDGKIALFVGDQNGGNEKQLAGLGEYAAHGWFTDDFLLVSKDSSELYIVPTTGLSEGQTPFKVTDYHKPDYVIRGYGGGY